MLKYYTGSDKMAIRDDVGVSTMMGDMPSLQGKKAILFPAKHTSTYLGANKIRNMSRIVLPCIQLLALFAVLSLANKSI